MFSDCDLCDSLQDSIQEAEYTGNTSAIKHYSSALAAHRRDDHGSDPEYDQ